VKAIAVILVSLSFFIACASRPRQQERVYIVQGTSDAVAVRPPARWQPIWPGARTSQVRFRLISDPSPGLTIRLDPAQPTDRQGQRAIHDHLLTDFRRTFVAPAGRTIALIPWHGQDVFVRLYTGVDSYEYSAVVPLGRETLSFWISDSHGESIELYKDDFIETVRSFTLQ
jgi:hypothetical protein